MTTTIMVWAGMMILSGVLGFVLGQRSGVGIEANDSEAYVSALAKMQRRLNEAEARNRRAEAETQKLKRRR
ncbi:hypothetical protein [Ascidiaceihabitans sp.]|uniref:hypothetical protein n=1 Tax=Ascidiaceihabitans sp. TaxID=1872644 RepID=UPI0032994CED